MKKAKTYQKRSLFQLLCVAVLVAAAIVPALSQTHVQGAEQIVDRSLTLQAGATEGGSAPGGVVNHLFEFTVPSADDIGSIKFEYCTTAADTGGSTCTTPTGLVTTGATLGSEVGSDISGFSIDSSTNGAPYLTRTVAAVSANASASLRLDNITNPTNVNETFFVRISTYGSEDTSGEAIDAGTVTASTAEPIVLEGIMPESLVFCTGETIGLTEGVPDCSTATDGSVSFDQLFSPTDTAVASSQMAASTNAGAGYSITVNGATMSSGTNEINAMDTSTTSVQGIGQFGLNLRENTTPVIGTEVAPVVDSTNYFGQAAPDYDTVDNFKFASGDPVANSNSSGTDAQIFTSAYIVNVPGNQPAGTYNTTLTYICTATF